MTHVLTHPTSTNMSFCPHWESQPYKRSQGGDRVGGLLFWTLFLGHFLMTSTRQGGRGWYLEAVRESESVRELDSWGLELGFDNKCKAQVVQPQACDFNALGLSVFLGEMEIIKIAQRNQWDKDMVKALERAKC